MKNKKIGILTWHYYCNFGSGLQAFALQKTIKDLGYSVKIINYRNPLFAKRVWWKDLIKFIIRHTTSYVSKKHREKYVSNTDIYQKRYLEQTKCFTEPKQISKITKGYSCIVYGSDQIWAPNVYSPIYMGWGISVDVRKISYAASIGLNSIPNDLVETYKKNLSSYHSIAVREQEGKELLKSKCGIDATVVLDPTLLVNADTYKNMLCPVEGVKGKFIFCYFLNKEHKYREKVEEYAKKQNLQIIGVSDKLNDSDWMNRLKNIGADHFLWLIYNAETIFTDSYHGSIFSLLFHKNLWIFTRFAEDSPICQNSRIRQLQNNFNLGHRIITADSQIEETYNINYRYFEDRLAELRRDSLAYLQKALP